jgi:hypothetical protein
MIKVLSRNEMEQFFESYQIYTCQNTNSRFKGQSIMKKNSFESFEDRIRNAASNLIEIQNIYKLATDNTYDNFKVASAYKYYLSQFCEILVPKSKNVPLTFIEQNFRAQLNSHFISIEHLQKLRRILSSAFIPFRKKVIFELVQILIDSKALSALLHFENNNQKPISIKHCAIFKYEKIH